VAPVFPPTFVIHLRDGSAVAAWMFKANPDVWDVLGALARREDICTWRMAPSYRVELVGPGQHCALWVTGAKGAAHTAGVWAMGHIVGEPYLDTGDPDDAGWRDPGAARQVRPYVAIELEVLHQPIDRRVLRADPRFGGAEILRRPRMGSPLALGADEWDALVDHAGG
jgi:hypothetical protein